MKYRKLFTILIVLILLYSLWCMTRNSEYNAVDAVINGITITGCSVATVSSLCTGVKVNVSASITTTDTSDVTTSRYTPSVSYLCCRDTGTSTALQNARNADVQFNTIYMNQKSSILDAYNFVPSST